MTSRRKSASAADHQVLSTTTTGGGSPKHRYQPIPESEEGKGEGKLARRTTAAASSSSPAHAFLGSKSLLVGGLM
jgi:hypothetical protein